jgi:predicted ATPase
MSPGAEQHMVSDMLDLDAMDYDKSQPLADFIYRQTKGNAFFSLQLLLRLIAEGFLFRETMTTTTTTSGGGGDASRTTNDGVDFNAAVKEKEQGSDSESSDDDGSSPALLPVKNEDKDHSFHRCSSWKWYPEEVILQRIACTDVAQLVTETILSLPPEQQYVLKVGACLGADFDEYTLHEVCQDACMITKTLNSAEEKGILSSTCKNDLVTASSSTSTHPSIGKGAFVMTEGQKSHLVLHTLAAASSSSTTCCGLTERHGWKYTHDMIHHSVYSLIDEPHRAAFHLHVGRKLWASATASDTHDSIALNVFVIVNQLKKGMGLLIDEEERYRMALLCLQAGEKSILGSGFQVAASYLNLAVDLLGRRHWRDQYHLSLDLFNAAAEVEYCNANFSRMDYYLEEVLKNARCFRNKLQAYTTKIYSLGTRGDMHHAIDLGLDVLKTLGESFPKKTPGLVRILFEYAKTKRMLNKFPKEDDILNLPSMVNDDKLAAARLLTLLFHYAMNCQPELAVLIAFRNLQIVLTNGLSTL